MDRYDILRALDNLEFDNKELNPNEIADAYLKQLTAYTLLNMDERLEEILDVLNNIKREMEKT